MARRRRPAAVAEAVADEDAVQPVKGHVTVRCGPALRARVDAALSRIAPRLPSLSRASLLGGALLLGLEQIEADPAKLVRP